jgi:hypothetical protein
MNTTRHSRKCNLPQGQDIFEAPTFRSFSGTLDIGFTLEKDMKEVYESLLLKRFLSYVLKIDPDFHIETIDGVNQSITIPNCLPTTNDGIELYFQHKVVKDVIRGKFNVTMPKYIGDMKDTTSTFRKYMKNSMLAKLPSN